MFTYWNAEAQEIESMPLSDLYRWDSPRAPSYTLYTGLSLGWSYLIFFGIMILQCLIMMWVKCSVSQQFSDGSITLKIRNTLQSLHITDFVCDWDLGHGDVQSHKKRWRRTMIEISAMICIQWIFNMILVIPIYIAGSIIFNTI